MPPRSSDYTADDKQLLDHLFRIHGKPARGYGNTMKYYKKVAKAFNSMTNGTRRSRQQIKNYNSNRKRWQVKQRKPRNQEIQHLPLPALPKPPSPRIQPLPPSMLSLQSRSDIVCKNIRSLGSSSSKKQKSSASSSSGYVGSSSDTQEEYRSLADDLPKSWEYTEISGSFLTSNDHGESSLGLDDRDEPHIFDDIDNFPVGRTSLSQDKNGMSSDLVNILSEQARQHHKLKIKLVQEKFRKVHEGHKMKMYVLESELEMKRKEHERRMDVLMHKYKKIKDNLEDQMGRARF